MGNSDTDLDEHPITSFKRGIIELKKVIRAFKTPVDPSEYIWEYGKISLNINTSLFKFGDKEIQMRSSVKVFKIIKLLVRASGNEVSYSKFIKFLGLPNKTVEERRQSKLHIGASIRDFRRRLGINANLEKEKNPFIATGRGIKLAFFSK